MNGDTTMRRLARLFRRRASMALMAAVLAVVGVHDGIETYREVSSPNAVMIDGEKYVRQWVPEKASQSTSAKRHEHDSDPYADLLRMVEDTEHLDNVERSSAQEASAVRIHTCFSRELRTDTPIEV